jgi:hypothetical protein
MKSTILLAFFSLLLIGPVLFGQGVINEGATITIENNTHFIIANGGGYYNSNSSGNYGRIDLSGTISISGDFTNDVDLETENVFLNSDDDGYIIFNGTADQTISNTLANAYIDFENLTINNGSNTVYLDHGSAITVNGDLTVSSGTFRLSSPSNGEGPTGSLITNTDQDLSSTGGTGAFYIDRHFETNGRYVYFSVPVSNAYDDLFTAGSGGAFNPNLYSYNEADDADPDPGSTNYNEWSLLTDSWVQVADDGSFVPLSGNAAGYVTFNNIELNVEFGGSPGNLNNSPFYSPAVTFNNNDANGGYFDGWNLVGNPYPSAIDWNDPNWDKTNISNTIYMWDGSSGNYIYYNNGFPNDAITDAPSINYDGDARYIPPMQAFFVKATGSPVLTIPNEARVHYHKEMYKEKNKDYDYEYIKLRTELDNFSDETLIRFFDDASPEVDSEYDAYKMFPWTTPVMIFSLAQNPETPVAINTLPVNEIGTMIPLGFLTENAGEFTIQAADFNFDISTEVTFIDQYENQEIIVNEDFEYTFSYNGGESRNRFFLFVAPQGTEIPKEEQSLDVYANVWSHYNKVFINISSLELLNSKVEVYDMTGKPIIKESLQSTDNVFTIDASAGTYFVKLITKDGKIRIDKVHIQK